MFWNRGSAVKVGTCGPPYNSHKARYKELNIYRSISHFSQNRPVEPTGCDAV
jgi:hypothetical protein